MIRRRHGVSLARAAQVEEDVNPNAYIVNIADCMLVLLLGTIVALISYYNVDLGQSSSDSSSNEIVGIEVNMDQNQDGVIDAGYHRQGTVYYDDSTGNYYFVDEQGA